MNTCRLARAWRWPMNSARTSGRRDESASSSRRSGAVRRGAVVKGPFRTFRFSPPSSDRDDGRNGCGPQANNPSSSVQGQGTKIAARTPERVRRLSDNAGWGDPASTTVEAISMKTFKLALTGLAALGAAVVAAPAPAEAGSFGISVGFGHPGYYG